MGVEYFCPINQKLSDMDTIKNYDRGETREERIIKSLDDLKDAVRNHKFDRFFAIAANDHSGYYVMIFDTAELIDMFSHFTDAHPMVSDAVVKGCAKSSLGIEDRAMASRAAALGIM